MKNLVSAPPPAPSPVDAGQSSINYVRSMADPALQQLLLESEQTYRPQYTNLNLQDINQYLFGTQSSQSQVLDVDAVKASRPDLVSNWDKDPRFKSLYGTLDNYIQQHVINNPNDAVYKTATSATGGTLAALQASGPIIGQIQATANTQQRAADIADVANLGSQASQAFRSANPELYAQLARADQLGANSNYFGGLQGAIGGARQFGDVQSNQFGTDYLGAYGNALAGARQFGDVQAQRVGAQRVGTGALGSQMYGQAINAGPSQINLALQQQGMDALAQGGNLSPAETRQLQQGVREAYASRGTEMGSAAVTAEAVAQQQAGRQRQLENIQLASGIGQQLTAEQQANRSYQQAVQQQELARQQGNVGTNLQSQLSNQQAMNEMALQNRQFGAGQQQQYLANLTTGFQNEFTNQQAANNLALQNRQFALGQQQQQISNLGLLGQLQQGQGAADRSYALQLAGAYGGASFDPMMAILGRQSSAPQMAGQQQGYASNLMGNLQGPQLFDPNAGINLALQNSSNLGNYQASTYGARAGAQGQITAGLFQGIGSAISCWVAREVYGIEDIRWMLFREWLMSDAPAWFRALYLKHGEKFAAWIVDKPRIKRVIRKFMDGRIESKFGKFNISATLNIA